MPTKCVGCQNLGAPICAECLSALQPAPRQVLRSFAGAIESSAQISGAAVFDYGPMAAKVIHAVKDQGQTSLIRFMADQISAQVASALDRRWLVGEHLVFVGLPSRIASVHARGFSHTAMLASAIASRVVGSRSMNLLEAGATADQAELGIQERARNLVGTMKVHVQVRPELLGASTIILVDDVVTTGATVLEAQRALITAGLQVGGFITFAETLRLFAPKAKNRSTFALTQSKGQEGKEATQNAS